MKVAFGAFEGTRMRSARVSCRFLEPNFAVVRLSRFGSSAKRFLDDDRNLVGVVRGNEGVPGIFSTGNEFSSLEVGFWRSLETESIGHA